MDLMEFLSNYWKQILEVCLVILSVVFMLIRKKPVQVVDTLKETIIRLLPYCIMKAESAPKGEKLAVCLTLLSQLLGNMGLPFTDSDKKFATEQVEVILSTPQKKGVKNER